MELSPSTVPGIGKLHHCRTRRGQRLVVLVEHSGHRSLFIDDLPPGGRGQDDASSARLILDPDEADQLAELLAARPVLSRAGVAGAGC